MSLPISGGVPRPATDKWNLWLPPESTLNGLRLVPREQLLHSALQLLQVPPGDTALQFSTMRRYFTALRYAALTKTPWPSLHKFERNDEQRDKAQRVPPPAIDARLEGRKMWVLLPLRDRLSLHGVPPCINPFITAYNSTGLSACILPTGMRGWPDDIGKSKKYYELGIPENAGWWDGKYNKYYSLEEAEEIAMRVGPTGLGGWWDGEISEYYTPEEAQQTATRLGLRDADFNVAWHINDGTDASSMFLKLDLNAYDPCVDPLSAPAEWAWYLEEPPPALAEDAQEAPPPAIDAQLVGRTVWVLCLSLIHI